MKFEAYISYLVKEFKPILGLREYSGVIQFPVDDKEATAMDINVDCKYLRFTMCVYPVVRDDFRRKQYDDIIEYVLHELCHIITEPLYERGLKGIMEVQKEDLETEREQSTQRIANAIYRCIKFSNYHPDEHKRSPRRTKRNSKRSTKAKQVRRTNRGVSGGTK